ncbi:helix-turn-helix domain-containing protein [Leifsonia shinshuensis]|uniref:helix-turn-helix domain-containing protein n=1 Tax=Leifsonia shinshuensis TaxID=150026 RepID=UPI00286551F7|nr:helix-turn-helix domain-containing protein [Leifsonia shinshuensis]MDR6972762.1 AraC-like DNA-binding protein [Leifsonia shinshuensis]
MLPTVQQHSFGFTARHDQPGPMAGAHRHDDVEVNTAGGDVAYLLNGVQTLIPAGRAAIFWAARPHQLVELRPGTRFTWLTVPLPVFLGWGLPDGFVSTLLSGGMIIPDVDPLELGARFPVWVEELGSASAFVDRTARLEVEAFVRRLSVARDTRTASTPVTTGATERVAAMAAFIAARFAEPIGVGDVAGSVHLHPNYAMALFKRVAGISIGGYLAQCRLAEAQRLLVATRLPVSDIAVAAGFGSSSQFYERFRAACGTTPALYRRQNSGWSERAEVTRTPAR